MKRVAVLSAMLACTLVAQAQTRLTIEDCHRMARANYPLIEQYELIQKSAEYSLANAAKGWVPQITLSAQASYQSEVVEFPVDFSRLGISGISLPTRDQYGVKIDINQTIWDGGTIKSQRDGVRASAEAEKASAEANIYALTERVNGLFFGILLAEEQLDQIAILEDNLKTNFQKIEAYVKNGVAIQTDLDAVRIEMLKANQRKAQLQSTKKAYFEMLSRLVGSELNADMELVKPSAAIPINNIVNRPELAMYDAQIKSIEARNRRLNASVTPRIIAYATGGYGKPALNMFSGKFEPYYVVGARLSWNIGGFYTRKNDRKQIQTDIWSVEVRRDAFLLNTDIDIAQKNTDIDLCQEQLRYDDEIIELRNSVRQASEVKMENGTITGSDLARDINAEASARQDKIVHEMELLSAIYKLKFAINN